LGEIRLGEMGLGEMGLGEMGQNLLSNWFGSAATYIATHLILPV